MKQELGIVTPVYSTERNSRLTYFRDTADSILAQDLDFLWVIVDDGSTDETPDYIQGIRDSRVSYIRLERTNRSRLTSSVGANAGLNYLMNKRCSYFAYVHSDDIITPYSLEKRVNALKEGAEMVYGKLAIYECRGLVLKDFKKPKEDHSTEVMRMDFPHHTSMWSRKMMKLMMNGRANSLFDTELDCVEDLDVTMYSRKIIEKHNFRLDFIDGILYIWVRSKDNITELVRERTVRKQVEIVFEKNGFDASDYVRESLLKKLIIRPGYWLPEKIKRQLRPIKNEISRLTGNRLYPGPEKSITQTVINPFWFRS